jgi:hypothetical protein
LPQFTHLTHLAVDTSEGPYSKKIQILGACPTLVSLESWHDPSPDDANTLQQVLISRNPPQNKHLKEFQITAPVVHASYIEYITFYAPDTLESIKICPLHIDFDEWTKKTGIDNILQLAHRMSKAKNSRIECKFPSFG